jgi:hypothetical protein
MTTISAFSVYSTPEVALNETKVRDQHARGGGERAAGGEDQRRMLLYVDADQPRRDRIDGDGAQGRADPRVAQDP